MHDPVRMRIARAHFIMLADTALRIDVDAPLLNVLRYRFPIVVQQGRFAAREGVTDVCVYARRSSGAQSIPDGALPRCDMIAVVVDGLRVGDAGSYLATVRVRDFESVELVSESEARFRYGVMDSEVLVLTTKRGRKR